MIVYKFESAPVSSMTCNDDGPNPIRIDTDKKCADHFVNGELQYELKKLYGEDYKGKRILDVGMGNGNILYYVRKLLDADVFGFDINDQCYLSEHEVDRIFRNTDVRDMPSELLGTFDVAYQRYFSVPFKDIPSVFLSISKALKPNGMYYVTFGDPQYNHKDAFVFHFLSEIYGKLIIKEERFRYWSCTALYPRENPTLTIPENYYHILDEEEARQYKSARTKEERGRVLSNKNVATLNFKN